MSWDDTENFRMGAKFVWPALPDAFAYRRCVVTPPPRRAFFRRARRSSPAARRRAVREAILHLIDTLPLTLPITPENPWWALFLGFEHER